MTIIITITYDNSNWPQELPLPRAQRDICFRSFDDRMSKSPPGAGELASVRKTQSQHNTVKLSQTQSNSVTTQHNNALPRAQRDISSATSTDSTLSGAYVYIYIYVYICYIIINCYYYISVRYFECGMIVNSIDVIYTITPGLRYKIPVFSDPAPGKS